MQGHGTATPLGDPTEAGALAAAARDKGRRGAWVITSHKASIGHGECSSGQCGLLSVLMALQLQAVAANAQLRVVNPMVTAHLPGDSHASPMMVSQPLLARGFGGVSAFGHSGTIVHIVMQPAQAGLRRVARAVVPQVHYRRSPFPWKASATTTQAVQSSSSPPIPFLGVCIVRSQAVGSK